MISEIKVMFLNQINDYFYVARRVFEQMKLEIYLRDKLIHLKD